MYAPEPVLGFDFSSSQGLYALTAGCFLISLATVALAARSRFGRALVAIREDEVLAAFLGINVVWHKVAAFMLSAMLAALAGAVYGPFMTFISPEMLSGSEAISLVGVLVVGGIGTLPGPILGTLILFGLPELFHVDRLYRLVTLGLVIILTVIFMPRGVSKTWGSLLALGGLIGVADA